MSCESILNVKDEELEYPEGNIVYILWTNYGEGERETKCLGD